MIKDAPFFHVEVQIFRKTHRKYLAAFNGKYQGIHWKISKISRGIQWRISRQSLEHIEKREKEEKDRKRGEIKGIQ